MHARTDEELKTKDDVKVEDGTTQGLVRAAQAVKIIIIKKEYAELLNKEMLCCLLATD